jgi:hypothetical protein
MSFSPSYSASFDVHYELPPPVIPIPDDPVTGVLGPCDWDPIYSDCEGDTCTHLDSMDPALAEVVQAAGVTWLWEATLRRYGNCPVTILPCLRQCSGYGSWPAWVPWRTAGGWVNVSCGRCGSSCSCSSISEIVLPTTGTVLGVAESETVLDSSAWRLDNHRYLVRLDGSWPVCQDLSYVEHPSLAVTYIPGLPVPAMGQLAAGTFICQLARRLCGASCDLPANASAVSRQGITITLDATTETGLWVVDQWVEMVNRATPRVYSPDVPVTRLAVLSGS